LDVALTLGNNGIGIQAVDWAGNVATLNFNYVFDTTGHTTPPVIALTWPQDQMVLSGSSFTLRGTLDDDTATVTGQWTDPINGLQTVHGQVERGGQFWLENLPLGTANSTLTITATDAAGNAATTSLTVTQSEVTLAMDTVPDSQLNQVMVNVTGEISDPNYVVWVNGVQGAVTANGDGTGSWSANNVPVTAGGTASFDVTAYPSISAPATASWANFAVQQSSYPNPLPAAIYYEDSLTALTQQEDNPPPDPVQYDVGWDKPSVVYVKTFKYKITSSETDAHGTDHTIVKDDNWAQGGGGDFDFTETNAFYQPGSSASDDFIWPPDAGDIPVIPGQKTEVDSAGNPTVDPCPPPNLWIEEASMAGVDNVNSTDLAPLSWTAQASQVVELFTGGKALRQVSSLFQLSQALFWEKYSDLYTRGDWSTPIPPQFISLGSLGNEGADANLYAVLPKGENVLITPQAPTSSSSTSSGGPSAEVSSQNQNTDTPPQPFAWFGGDLPNQNEFPLTIQANFIDLSANTPTFCVGQNIAFATYWPNGGPIFTSDSAWWTLPGTFVNQQPYSYCPGYYDENDAYLNNLQDPLQSGFFLTSCWYSQALDNGTVGLKITMTFPNGKVATASASGQFSVYRPSLPGFRASTPTPNVAIWGGQLNVGTIQQGVFYTFEVESSVGGQAEITQVFDDSSSPASVNKGSNVLDKNEIYPSTGIPIKETPPSALSVNSITFTDSADNQLMGNSTSLKLNYQDYVRFKPTGGPGQNIYVTLGKVTWKVDAVANFIGGTSPWQVQQDPPPIVSLPQLDPTSVEFPYWNSVYSP